MENNFEYIDAYFDHALSAEEIRQFEQKIAEDEDFANDVAFYLAAKQSLKDQVQAEKKEQFKQLLEQNAPGTEFRQQGRVKKMWMYRIAAAAAIVVCIFLAWYLFFPRPASPQQMADDYINENLMSLPVTMGTSYDSIQNGLRLYNNKQYDSALLQFEAIIQRDPENYLAKKYEGIVYLGTGNYDKSLQVFQGLETYSRESNPAIFYQALTLLKHNQSGDKQKARQLLQQVVEHGLEGKETARQWLKKW